MGKERVQVLNQKQILNKINRIAHEIYERNYKEKELVLIGVEDFGAVIAKSIFDEVKKISPLKLHFMKLKLDKDSPFATPVELDGDIKTIKNKAVILIDDVLNSGRTLIHATQFLLNENPRSLSTATLVDRFHRRFPIRADYVGLTLSTNLKEHISVVKEKGKLAAYLE